MEGAGQQCSSARAAQWQFLCSFLKYQCLECPLKLINQDPWGWVPGTGAFKFPGNSLAETHCRGTPSPSLCLGLPALVLEQCMLSR